MEKVNPRIDIAFKKLFGTEENKDLLISLINSMVSQEDQVADIRLMNPYNLQRFREDRLSILDIKAEGVCGKKFNIEIQLTDNGDYGKRALYYWAKLYTEQLITSDRYHDLEKVIGIHILNFISIPQAKKYHNVFHITEKEEGFPHFESLELHTIELKKFSETTEGALGALSGKVQNSLDMWTAFLTRYEQLSGMQRLPVGLDKPALKKAIDVLDVMNFTGEEREIYEEHLKWLRMEAGALSVAKETGKKEGMAIGEKKRSKEIALQMLSKGYAVSEIQQLTGLKREDIKALGASRNQ